MAGNWPTTPTVFPTSCTVAWPRGCTPEQIVALTAFGGMMIATNVFNNALQVDLDDYLQPFRKSQGRLGQQPRLAMSELAGRVALITGAAHGQGRATALALALEGANVAALDVARQLPYPGYGLGTSEALDSLVSECRQLGVRGDRTLPPTCATTRPWPRP